MKFARTFFISIFVFLSMISQSVSAAEIAGTVERQLGEASRNGSTALSVGSSVFVGDTIATGENSKLIIRFNDQSTLKFGEKASMVIDEMVYEPAGRNPEGGSQAVKFAEGVFEFVSGTIGRNLPESVALNTPVATIGIRGTRVIFGVLTVGMPPGVPHYGFQIYEGAVEITSPEGSVILDEPGEGTFLPLTRVAAPTPVRQWTPEEAQEARDAVDF